MPEHGQLLKHQLTTSLYRYMGEVPTSGLHALATYDGQRVYTVETSELHQYYELAIDPNHLQEGKSYLSTETLSTFEVEKIYKNPDNGELVAFGWYRYNNPSGRQAEALAHLSVHNKWNHWTPIIKG